MCYIEGCFNVMFLNKCVFCIIGERVYGVLGLEGVVLKNNGSDDVDF